MHIIARILFVIIISLQLGIVGAFTTPQNANPDFPDFSERVIIHTDRDFYIAGERKYFRLDILGSDNGQVSGIGYLILRNRNGQVIESTSSRINVNRGFGSLYLPDTLSTGIYQLAGFTNWMRNFGEEHYATKEILVVNRFDETARVAGLLPVNPLNGGTTANISMPENNNREYSYNNQQNLTDHHVTIRPSKSVYGTREKVTIELLPTGINGSYASLAVSVSQAQSVFHERLSETDNHEDTKFSQNNLIQGYPYFLRESGGRIITGQVIHKDNRRGIPDVMVIMTSADTVLNLLYAKTLNDGSFHFRLNEYHEGKTLYFSLLDSYWSQNAEIQMIEKINLTSRFEPGSIGKNELSGDFIRSSQDIVRINKALDIDHHAYIETDRQGYRPEIYSLPDYSISNFSDYEYLENLHEIARELLPVLMIRVRDGLYTSRMALQFRGLYGRELPPAYFLDGIYVDDLNRIVHLDSDNLRSLEMHNHYWRHGELMFPGIVALFSNNQAYRNLVLAEPSVAVENPYFTEESVYNPVDYGTDSVDSSMPDFRQLLYWNPEVIVENDSGPRKIEFYTGDLNGEFTIQVNGHTGQGDIISERYSFTVDHKTGVPPVSTGLSSIPVNKWSEIVIPEQKPGMDDSFGINIPAIPVNITERYFDQGLSGKLKNPPHQPIGNQHYPSEQWLLGDVHLETGIVVRDKRLRYNGYIDELFWLYEGDYQQIQLDRNFVKEFTIYLPGNTEPLVFHKIGVDAPLLTGRDNIFGELLYGGILRLYAFRRISGSRTGEQWIDDVSQAGPVISPSHLFVVILPDGTSKIIRRISRRNLLSLFPGQRRELRNLMRDNRISRLRSEQDLIDALRLLESHLEGY